MLRSPSLLTLVCALLLPVLVGCPANGPITKGGKSAAKVRPAGPLKVLVVDDPTLGEAIAREWRSRTEGELAVENYTSQRLMAASRLPGDIVIFAVGDIGSLAERGLILPLDDDALATAEYDRQDIFDQVRLRDVSWGNRTFAAPLGSPQLLLVYRADIFEQLGIAPPQTWDEYERVANKLASQRSESPLIPAIEPLAPGWAGQMLLARAASYVTHRDQVSSILHYSTLEPMITTPPYVKALKELMAVHTLSSSAMSGAGPSAAEADAGAGETAEAGATQQPSRPTPTQVMDALGTGQAAMGLSWPAPSSVSDPTYDARLGFALIPGSSDVYNFARGEWESREMGEQPRASLLAISGRLAAVTTSSSDPQGAQNVVGWLASRDVSPVISPTSSATTLFRASQLPDARRWTAHLDGETAGKYGEMVQQATSRDWRHISLRIPGRHEYLDALDEAVQTALRGEMSAEEALAKAAVDWQSITEKYGRDAQRRALKHDLGLEKF